MERKIKTSAFVRAAAIFFIMFVVISVSAFIKYRAYGSFTGAASNKSLILALAGSGISVLFLLVALFTYFVYSRQRMIEKTKRLAAICTAVGGQYFSVCAWSVLYANGAFSLYSCADIGPARRFHIQYYG